MTYASSGYYNRDPGEVVVYSLAADGDTRLSLDFLVREFRSRDGSDTIVIHPALLYALQAIRTEFGVPVTINSGYRTVDHNDNVGGEEHSYHTMGMAADIALDAPLGKVASYARDVLGMGVGLKSGYVHVSVGVEGGTDRTIIGNGYLPFRDMYGGGRLARVDVIREGPLHLQASAAMAGVPSWVGLLLIGGLIASGRRHRRNPSGGTTTVHVVPGGPKDLPWRVKPAGRSPVSEHKTKAAAVRAGRRFSRRRGGELVIHGRNGRFQLRNSHGGDPTSRPG